MSIYKLSPSTSPLTVDNLIMLLREGRDGNGVAYTDEEIAHWCYEFYVQHTNHAQEALYKAVKVASDVSGQWHSDVANVDDQQRVLAPELYEEWLRRLEASDT